MTTQTHTPLTQAQIYWQEICDLRDKNAALLAALELVELRLNQVQPGHGTRANDLRDYLLPPICAAIAAAKGGN